MGLLAFLGDQRRHDNSQVCQTFPIYHFLTEMTKCYLSTSVRDKVPAKHLDEVPGLRTLHHTDLNGSPTQVIINFHGLEGGHTALILGTLASLLRKKVVIVRASYYNSFYLKHLASKTLSLDSGPVNFLSKLSCIVNCTHILQIVPILEHIKNYLGFPNSTPVGPGDQRNIVNA